MPFHTDAEREGGGGLGTSAGSHTCSAGVAASARLDRIADMEDIYIFRISPWII